MSRRLALAIGLSLVATQPGQGQSGLSEVEGQASRLMYRPATDTDS